MTVRYVELLAWIVVASLYGWYAGSLTWVFVGACAGALLALSVDTWRFHRMLDWLQREDWSNPPSLPPLWSRVTERVRKLQKAWSSKARDSQHRLDEFLSAIQASPNGVLLLDSEARIEWCNQTAADHLGIDAQRDLLQHITNLMRDPAFSSYLSKRDFQHEVSIAGPGSSPSKPVVISVRIHPYGKKRKLMLTRDVTAVQQAEAMRRDFVANVSHEIRTPLTVLAGFVETLQTLQLSADEQSQYLALMAQQADRMQTLVSDLLTLSRLEGSPTPNRQDAVLVSDLLGSCLAQAQGLSDVLTVGPPHALTLQLDQDFRLAGHADELSSAVGNLLSNAVRYTPAGGRIVLGARTLAEGEAEVWVSDTGPGIAAEHLPRLTERFYRVDRSRSRETGGTGLGLAIVKHVVQRHGGQVAIQSQVGEGSTFTLRFPADRVRPVMDPRR